MSKVPQTGPSDQTYENLRNLYFSPILSEQDTKQKWLKFLSGIAPKGKVTEADCKFYNPIRMAKNAFSDLPMEQRFLLSGAFGIGLMFRRGLRPTLISNPVFMTAFFCPEFYSVFY